MAKVELIERTKEAIEAAIFDEIGIIDQPKDPILVGTIKSWRPERWAQGMMFLIAWYVDTKTL